MTYKTVQNDTPSVGGVSNADQSFLSPFSDYRSPQVSIASTIQAQASPAFTDQTLTDRTLDTNYTPSVSSNLNHVAQQIPAIDPVLFPEQAASDPLAELFNDPAIDPAWFNIEPDVFFGELGHSCGFIPSAPNIVDDVDKSQVIQSTETDTTTPMSFGTAADK